MEIRWAGVAAMTRDMAHPGSIQGSVSSRNLAPGSPQMGSTHFCVCSFQTSVVGGNATTSTCSVFSSGDLAMGRSRSSFSSGLPRSEGRLVVLHHGLAGGRDSPSAGFSGVLVLPGGLRRVLTGRGVRRGVRASGGDFPSTGFNGVLVLPQRLRGVLRAGRGVRRASSGVLRGGRDQIQTPKASSDSSSSQPTSPASSSSPSASTTATTSSPKKHQNNGFLMPILRIPKSIWRQVVLPLSNFGFGKTSIWEGGVGLFVISGAVLLAITLTWVKGTQIRARSQKYEAVIEFDKAQGITVGTPVRIRGVDVGSVVGMKPSLERIDVVVQLVDTGIVIPRNALVEVNQSGLISETLIDVTPRDPLPRPTVGPLDPLCVEEGVIVCDRGRIKGEQGVSLDELVGICTKIAKQMGELGVSNMYGMAERITVAIDEARPLLGKVEILAGDIEPLLKELKDGVLLKDLERLTRVVAEAGDDLRTLNKSVLTAENTELLRKSIVTLTKTLSHIESISQDVSGVTGDAGTKKNLLQLIESLSRLVMD